MEDTKELLDNRLAIADNLWQTAQSEITNWSKMFKDLDDDFQVLGQELTDFLKGYADKNNLSDEVIKEDYIERYQEQYSEFIIKDNYPSALEVQPDLKTGAEWSEFADGNRLNAVHYYDMVVGGISSQDDMIWKIFDYDTATDYFYEQHESLIGTEEEKEMPNYAVFIVNRIKFIMSELNSIIDNDYYSLATVFDKLYVEVRDDTSKAK